MGSPNIYTCIQISTILYQFSDLPHPSTLVLRADALVNLCEPPMTQLIAVETSSSPASEVWPTGMYLKYIARAQVLTTLSPRLSPKRLFNYPSGPFARASAVFTPLQTSRRTSRIIHHRLSHVSHAIYIGSPTFPSQISAQNIRRIRVRSNMAVSSSHTILCQEISS